MAIKPTAGRVLIRPILFSDARAEEIKKRTGLLLAKPDNKHSFEGVPNQGHVYALPDGYDGELKIGARVVFAEQNPKGFKDPDDHKISLFSLELKQILAEVTND